MVQREDLQSHACLDMEHQDLMKLWRMDMELLNFGPLDSGKVGVERHRALHPNIEGQHRRPLAEHSA